MSFTVIQQDSFGGIKIIILNYTVSFFSPVLANTETVTEINLSFFLKKKLYIQFAVDIPYVFVFIYDYQFM